MPASLSAALTVGASYTLATPDVSLTFVPDVLLLRSTAGDYFYSFDGVNDHGMVFAADTWPLEIRCKQQKVWLKQNGGAATARVSAYTSSGG